MPWYPLYTTINGERRAAQRIEDIGFDVLLPLERRRRPSFGDGTYVTALFPRYLFAYVRPGDWPAILEIAQVIDVLRHNAVPARVPDEVIEGLRLQIAVGMFDYTRPPAIGMPATLRRGPFAEFLGKVVQVRRPERVKLLISMLGRMVVVDAPVMLVKEVA